MIHSPCRDCNTNTEDYMCHGKCQAYKDYVKANEEEREKIRKAKQKNARTVYMSDRQFKNALHNHSENRVFRQHMK